MLVLTVIDFHYKNGVKIVTGETPVAYISPRNLEDAKQNLKNVIQDKTEQICNWITYATPTASNVISILQNEDKDTLFIIYELPNYIDIDNSTF